MFEQYRDALRRGHAALAAGRPEMALAGYREAIDLARDRPAPHVGMGQALLRQGDPKSALAAFDAALSRARRDEAALRGRADALARLGRRTEAAETLDVLAELQEASGRLAEAHASTQRALDLAEQKVRRRALVDLTRRLRLLTPATDVPPHGVASGRTSAADDAIAPDVPVPPARGAGTAETPAGVASPSAAANELPPADAPSLEAPPSEPASMDAVPVEAAGVTPFPGEDEVVAAASSEPAAAQDATGDPDSPDALDAPPAGPDTPHPEAEPEPETLTAGSEPAFVPPPIPSDIMDEADRAVDAGDLAAARRAYLAAAAGFEHEGRYAAALDSCYVALAFAPADADVHLQLVDLYVELGWQVPAADKLALLGRLAALEDPGPLVRARIVGLAADHFPDDPRLRGMSARPALTQRPPD